MADKKRRVAAPTSEQPKKRSIAEANRTQGDEMVEEFGSESDDQANDVGATLLTGFDSGSDDGAQDVGDMSKTPAIPDYKKTSNKLRKAQEAGSDKAGAVYVGRIPHGFYEAQMRAYFTQFGDITRLRLSRNKRTGASKHFAFIEFASDEVAKIVAETMDNYLMFGHILKCRYAPVEDLHPDVWKGANKKYRKIPHAKLEQQRLLVPKTVDQWAKKNAQEQRKREKKAAQLKAIGYEYNIPQLKDPKQVLEQRQIGDGESQEQQKAVEAQQSEPDTAAKRSTAEQSRIGLPPLTEHNLDTNNAANEPAGRRISDAQSTEGDATTTAPAPLNKNTSTTTKAKRAKAARAITGRDAKDPNEASTVTSAAPTNMSSRGAFDNLPSVPVGGDLEAYLPKQDLASANNQPNSAADAVIPQRGVADVELAKRLSARKESKRERRKAGKK